MGEIKKTRAANLDLLRMLSMALIVMIHTFSHGGVRDAATNCDSITLFYIRIMYMLCMVCVNVYVMLSGYFSVNSKFSLHKLVVLWIEIVFYSVAIRGVFVILGKEPVSAVSLLSCFFPILTGRYWFLSKYFGLYLLMPFLNLLIRSMNKRQHGILNIMLAVLLPLLSSAKPFVADMTYGGGYGLPWFCMLYLAAAWFRLYYSPDKKPYKGLLVYVTIPAILAFIYVLAKKLDIGKVATLVSNWERYDSFPVYIMTVCLFVAFLNITINNVKVSRFITGVAPLTLGVYLIHDHADVSKWLWEMLDIPSKMGSWWFVPLHLGCILAIYVICIGIDLIRSETIGRLGKAKWLVSACNNIQNFVKEKLDSVLK